MLSDANAPAPPIFPPRINPKFKVNPHTGRLQFGRVGMHEEYFAMNNLSQCSESVQVALAKVSSKRWGAFDYDCFRKTGSVVTVRTSSNSAIANDYMGFIHDNTGIFGISPKTRIELRHGSRGEQIYHGVRVASGVYSVQKQNVGQYRDENWFELTAFLSDTSAWTFDPRPKISKEDAIVKARSYWEPHRPPDMHDWRLSGAEYSIRTDSGADCPKNPSGAWFVTAYGTGPRAVTKTFIYQVIVDGKTGQACSMKGTGEADF